MRFNQRMLSVLHHWNVSPDTEDWVFKTCRAVVVPAEIDLRQVYYFFVYCIWLYLGCL